MYYNHKLLLDPTTFFNPKTFWGPKLFLYPKFSFGQTFFRNVILFDQNFFFTQKNFRPKFFFDQKRSSLVFWYKPTKPKSFEPKTFQAEHFRPKSCSTPFFGAAAFCTTKIDDFRVSLTMNTLTTLSTYTSKRRSLRWTSSQG